MKNPLQIQDTDQTFEKQLSFVCFFWKNNQSSTKFQQLSQQCLGQRCVARPLLEPHQWSPVNGKKKGKPQVPQTWNHAFTKKEEHRTFEHWESDLIQSWMSHLFLVSEPYSPRLLRHIKQLHASFGQASTVVSRVAQVLTQRSNALWPNHPSSAAAKKIHHPAKQWSAVLPLKLFRSRSGWPPYWWQSGCLFWIRLLRPATNGYRQRQTMTSLVTVLCE